MARLKLKQILSNIHYKETANSLIISGSGNPQLIISGSALITSSPTVTGSLTINGVDTFGDTGSFNEIDLGENQF
jgi:hypothetical protein